MISGKIMALGTSLTLLSLGSSPTLATDRNQTYIEACRQEIQQYYGEERSLAVVNKRRGADGTRVTLAARSDRDNAEFIKCWIPNEERDESLDLGNDKLAARVSPVPVIR